MNLRLFAAIAPPEDIRERLAAAQAGLEGFRTVPKQKFHITLAFFGEIGAREAEDLDLALREVRAEPFELWLDGVGAFGGDRPRVAYAAVRPEPRLAALRDKVRSAARAAGLRLKAGRYAPHVTLARGASGRALARWLESRGAFLAGPFPVSELFLYRSELGRAAPIYTPISRYPLMGHAPHFTN